MSNIGANSTVGIRDFDVQRSQVRKTGKFRLNYSLMCNVLRQKLGETTSALLLCKRMPKMLPSWVPQNAGFSFTFLSYTTHGAVGWGTALQAGRSPVRFPMVSLEFFIDITLPPMALRLTQSLTEMSTRKISWMVKAAGAYGW